MLMQLQLSVAVISVAAVAIDNGAVVAIISVAAIAVISCSYQCCCSGN